MELRPAAADRRRLYTVVCAYRIVLAATAVALGAGTCRILLLELENVLAYRPWHERLLIAGFQSVSAHTAGFNTIDIAALPNPTLHP